MLIVTIAFFVLFAMSSRLRMDERERSLKLNLLYEQSFFDSELNYSVNILSLRKIEELLLEVVPRTRGDEVASLAGGFSLLLDEYGKETDENLRKQKAVEMKDQLDEISLCYSRLSRNRDISFVRMIYFLSLATTMQIGIFLFTFLKYRTSQLSLKQKDEIIGLLQKTREREKQKLASFLHDSILQELGEVQLKLSGKDVGRELGQSIGKLRRITYDLIPLHLEQLGIVEAVRDLSADYFPEQVKVDISTFGFYESMIPDEYKLTLFRMIQECANNIRKHSRADKVKILFTASHPFVIITIRDNGTGFNTEQKVNWKAKGNGLGLSMLKLQAEQMGGELLIQSRDGEGTEVKIRLDFGGENG